MDIDEEKIGKIQKKLKSKWMKQAMIDGFGNVDEMMENFITDVLEELIEESKDCELIKRNGQKLEWKVTPRMIAKNRDFLFEMDYSIFEDGYMYIDEGKMTFSLKEKIENLEKLIQEKTHENYQIKDSGKIELIGSNIMIPIRGKDVRFDLVVNKKKKKILVFESWARAKNNESIQNVIEKIQKKVESEISGLSTKSIEVE